MRAQPQTTIHLASNASGIKQIGVLVLPEDVSEDAEYKTLELAVDILMSVKRSKVLFDSPSPSLLLGPHQNIRN